MGSRSSADDLDACIMSDLGARLIRTSEDGTYGLLTGGSVRTELDASGGKLVAILRLEYRRSRGSTPSAKTIMEATELLAVPLPNGATALFKSQLDSWARARNGEE